MEPRDLVWLILAWEINKNQISGHIEWIYVYLDPYNVFILLLEIQWWITRSLVTK